MKDGEQVDPILWIAGTSWDGVAATDKCLVSELALLRPVLWVDPPAALTPATFADAALSAVFPAREPKEHRLTTVSRNIWRLRVPPMRGAARPVLRGIRTALLQRAVTRALNELAWEPTDVVIAHAFTPFPKVEGARKVYFVTDDWLEGSELMGVPRGEILRVLKDNLADADTVLAVSEFLVGRLQKLLPARGRGTTPLFGILPNGCPQINTVSSAPERRPTVCLVGQLNERLDIELLGSLQVSGIPMVVIGPRTDRDPGFSQQLDSFLAADNVQWMGRLESSEVRQQLQLAAVGITPYADTAFNRSSFPLKTLEYLAAGLAVVSTDTPSARWLDTDLVVLRSEPEAFVRAVHEAVEERQDAEQERRRTEFAARHSWAARAFDFQQLVGATARRKSAGEIPLAGEEIRS